MGKTLEKTTQDQEVKTQMNENKSQKTTEKPDGKKTIPVFVTEEKLKNILHFLMKMVKISQNVDPKQWEQI